MIKKKFITSILLIFILITAIGCTPKNQTSEISSPETVIESVVSIEEETTVAETSTESFLSEEITVSDFNELPDDIKGTIIPMDSLLLYHTETGNTYDAGDSYMLWRTLQYAFGNFGLNYNRAELKDYALSCEPMVVGEFTTAILDGDYTDYPIPEKLSDDIKYDSETDTYLFGVGDRGLSQTEILTYHYLEDHTLKVTARLYAQDDDSTICSGTFYFKRNEYASGVIEPLFYFTVTDAEFTMP